MEIGSPSSPARTHTSSVSVTCLISVQVINLKEKYRYSIPFFSDVVADARLAPLDESRHGGKEPTAGERMLERLETYAEGAKETLDTSMFLLDLNLTSRSLRVVEFQTKKAE